MKSTFKVAVILLIACLTVMTLSGCPSSDGESTAAPTLVPTATTTLTPIPTQVDTPASGGIVWDLPLVAGPTIVQDVNWPVPEMPGTWSNREERYYIYYSPPHVLAHFYRDQALPDDGWNQVMYTETVEEKFGYWTKNNESDGAMVWAMAGDGRETYLVLIRAVK